MKKKHPSVLLPVESWQGDEWETPVRQKSVSFLNKPTAIPSAFCQTPEETQPVIPGGQRLFHPNRRRAGRRLPRKFSMLPAASAGGVQ
jgi:hypothetical protein